MKITMPRIVPRFTTTSEVFPIEDDEIMASSYVISLYTNIATIDMLNIIKDYVNNDDQFTRKMAISQDNLIWF